MNIFTGTLVSFDSGSFLASVRLRGSGAHGLSGIPASRAIASVEMVPGRTVLVHLPAGGDAGTAVVIAIVG